MNHPQDGGHRLPRGPDARPRSGVRSSGQGGGNPLGRSGPGRAESSDQRQRRH